ncbi:MAG: spore germination protein, partial [Acutalibacteraceae bacterium]
SIFKKDAVLRLRRIAVRNACSYDCALFYMDGMINSELLNESVIRPLLTRNAERKEDSLVGFVSKQVLFAGETAVTDSLEDMLRSLLYGDTLLLIDGCREAITINTKGWRTRGISEPEDERVLQGPREGFDEAALLNLAMIRRKLLTPDLCTEAIRVGRRSDTLVFICYLDSLVNKRTLEELKKRVKKLDMDGILDSNYIAEQIRDHPRSLFKTCGSTERPDIVAARLLEGRIALVVDGTPVVMTVPYLFSENFQSDEDYYLNYTVSSVGRMLRFVCFFLSVSIPAVFIAATSYHKELLPTSLALTVAQLRGGVPFSAFWECILLILVFEILKETGVRMPQSLGHALSIVGGLVVGQAAVEARIVSAPMLIIVALSGISGLMVPRLKGAVFYLRVIYVVLSALLGLYGYILGVSLTLIHILDLSSFGTSSTVSLDRASLQSLKDTLWRAPWEKMRTRPFFNRNIIRAGEKKSE